MASSVATGGKIRWELDAPTDKLERDFSKARSLAGKTSKKVEEDLSGSAKRTGGAFSRLKDTILGVFIGNLITNAVLRVKQAIIDLGKETLQTGKNFEQWRVAFDTMLGSSNKARKMLSDLSDFAAETPFDLPQVVEGAKSLLAYSIEAKKIIPTFEALGNIASGVGTHKLPQLTLAFGQVRAAGKLTGQELRQFTEAGVPLLEVLAKQSGKTAAEIKKDMEDGAAPSFEEVEKAIFSMSKKGGKFFNLMRKQSKTLGGTMSNIRDQTKRLQLAFLGLTVTGDEIKGGLFDVLKQGARDTLASMNRNMEKLQDTFMRIGTAVANLILVLKRQFGRLGGPVIELGKEIGNLFTAIGGGTSAIGGVEAVLGALITVIIGLVKAITFAIKITAKFVEGLRQGKIWAIALATALAPIGVLIAGIWAVNKANAFIDKMKEVRDSFRQFRDDIIKTKDELSKLAKKVKEFASQKSLNLRFDMSMKGEAAKEMAGNIASAIGGFLGALVSREALVAVLAGLGKALAAAAGAVAGAVSGLVLAIVAAVVAVLVAGWFLIFTEKGREIRRSIGEFFTNAFNTVKDKAKELGPKIVEFFKGIPGMIVQGIVEGIPQLARIAGLIVGHILATLAGVVILVIAGIVRVGLWIARALWNALKAAFEFAVDAVVTGVKIVAHFFKNLYNAVKNAVMRIPAIVISVFFSIKAFLTVTVPQIITSVVNWFKELPGKIISFIKTLPERIRGIFNRVKTFVTQTVPEIIRTAVDWFKKLPGRILNVISSLPGKLYDFGKKLIQKIGSGIKNALGGIYNWGKNVISSFLNGIKDAIGNNPILKKALNSIGVKFESHSPPKEGPLRHMDKWGINIGKTYVDAVSKGLKQASIRGLNSLEAVMSPNVVNNNKYVSDGSEGRSVTINQKNEVYNQLDMDKNLRDLAWAIGN